jgi:hypothetical protein
MLMQLADLYHADAINHQVVESPVRGVENIRAMFKTGFDTAEMVCIRENLFEDGEWAILEWRVLKSVASTAINCSYFNVLVNKSLSQSTTYQHHVSTRRQNSSTGARRPCRQVP